MYLLGQNANKFKLECRGERGPSQSHIMCEIHYRKQQKKVSTSYLKGTSKGTRYKHLAPKDESLTPDVS